MAAFQVSAAKEAKGGAFDHNNLTTNNVAWERIFGFLPFGLNGYGLNNANGPRCNDYHGNNEHPTSRAYVYFRCNGYHVNCSLKALRHGLWVDVFFLGLRFLVFLLFFRNNDVFAIVFHLLCGCYMFYFR